MIKKETNAERINAYTNLSFTFFTNSFIEDVGMQGIRYVFRRNASWYRRLIWLIVLLASVTYSLYISINNLLDYQKFPTSTKLELHFVDKMEFPAVTICNYNVYQRSKMTAKENMMLSDMYQPYVIFRRNEDKKPSRWDAFDMDDFANRTSFDYASHMGM
uniref:acid-sensing ion channel 5-like n=1 Tax=Styela clava TaxID=7725 RepID=UPI00193A2B6A|nr:acid-sensing ion channel 5-like [Styela clava]